MKNYKKLSLLLALTLTVSCSAKSLISKTSLSVNSDKAQTESLEVKTQASKTENKPDKYIAKQQKLKEIIKSGDDIKINDLWHQIQKLTDKQEKKWQESDFIAMIASYQPGKLDNFFSKPTPTKDEINSAISGAAEVGNLDLVNQFLAKGGNISTAVEAAARGNNIDLVDKLLDRGARFNSAISGAIQHKNMAKKLNQFSPKDVELLNKLLEEKDGNYELRYINLSPLATEAACLNDRETIDVLFYKDADLKAAIIAAMLCGHEDLKKELLLKERDKVFSVGYAAQFEEETMWKLLEQGASKSAAIAGVKSREKPNKKLIKQIQEFKINQIENKE